MDTYNHLTEEQKKEIKEEIESILRRKTSEMLDELEKKFPYANREQLSGLLGGNNKRIIICDKEGTTYWKGDNNTSRE